MKWSYLLKSRKFWASIIGILFLVIRQFLPDFPIDEEATIGFVMIIVSYILGTAIDDNVTKGRNQLG